MKRINPFQQSKFEFDSPHLYYLSPEILTELEAPKPVYLLGTRGTGKTTLLKALSWKERLNNEQLREALRGELFEKHYLGLYMKLAKSIPLHFHEWLKMDPRYEELFGLLIDFIWLEDLAVAISVLCTPDPQTGKLIFSARPKDEQEAIYAVLEKLPELNDWKRDNESLSFYSISLVFRRLRKFLQTSAADLKIPDTMLAKLPRSPLGEIGREIANHFAEFCDNYSDGNSPWYFKICIDEAEWLLPGQELILNKMVRLSERPVLMVVSYVRGRGELTDISSTETPSISLSYPDRTIIFLDKITSYDREFFEGVATVRVQHILKRPDVKFDLKRVLGSLNINSLLTDIIKRSKSPEADQWFERAKKLKSSAFWSKKLSENEAQSEFCLLDLISENDNEIYTSDISIEDEIGETFDSLPIYQAYVIERLNWKYLLDLNPDGEDWKSRMSKLEQIRQKMVAAYLCLCDELGRQDVLYAFGLMVKDMSDNCIRDFLNQMSEVFVASDLDLQEFLQSRIPITIQHHALVKASKNKHDNIDDSRAHYPKELFRIIEVLGRITRKLQSDSSNTLALTSSERGKFVLDLRSGIEEEKEKIRKYIDDGIEAGYLHSDMKGFGNRYTFRVHSSLAAYYKFSYRGAYKHTFLDQRELLELTEINDSADIEQVIENTVKRITQHRTPKIKDPRQTELFNIEGE